MGEDPGTGVLFEMQQEVVGAPSRGERDVICVGVSSLIQLSYSTHLLAQRHHGVRGLMCSLSGLPPFTA